MRLSDNVKSHVLLLERLISRQCNIIKSLIVYMDNRFNEVFLFFSPFNHKFSLGNRLINIFPSNFSFYPLNRKNNNNTKSHLFKLNNLTLLASSDSWSVIVVIDTSIKSQVATSISHVHSHDRLVIKTIHHTVNVMTTEAKLFAIRYSINQAICLPSVSKIFVITDFIHVARRIFESSSHLYQAQLATISGELREFFKKDSSNSIEFWNYPSNHKWPLYDMIYRETKEFNLSPVFSCKSSWAFHKKSKYNFIFNNWKMSFQALDTKGYNFLELLDEDSKSIELYISKGGP